MSIVLGTNGNDFIHVANDGQPAPAGSTEIATATDGDDIISAGGGGDDAIHAGGGNDVIVFGDDLGPTDLIDGGAGTDTLVFDAHTVVFGAGQLAGIETILLTDHPVDDVLSVTLNDANVAAGQDLVVDASRVGAGAILRLDFAAETDARTIAVIGGAGNDVVRGRAAGLDGFTTDVVDFSQGGEDSFTGSADVFFGGALSSGDHVDGNSVVHVDGDYSAGLILTGRMFGDLDDFEIGPTTPQGADFDYRFTTTDDFVAANAVQIFAADFVPAGNHVVIDGSAETNGAFAMLGGASDDTFIGGAKNDLLDIFNGGGTDTVIGNAGDDVIRGGAFVTIDDRIDGGAGNDVLTLNGDYSFQHGFLRLDNISGIETIKLAGIVGAADDYFLIANDAVVGAGRSLTVDGSLIAAGHSVTFDGLAETDGSFVLIGGTGNDSLTGGDAADIITGGGGDDVLHGGFGADVLNGGDGIDLLDGGVGVDTMTGGAGDDIYVVDNAGDRVIEAAGGGTDTVATFISLRLGAGQSVEELRAADANGDTAINLSGNEFDQAIIGSDGNDFIDGKGGADTMTGRNGDDTYVVDDVSDSVIEAAGGGTDRVKTSHGYTLGDGQSIEVFATTDSAGTSDIALVGNEFGQTIVGNAGDNFIGGGGGADILIGLGGDDGYAITDARARITEAAGGGTDTVVTSVAYALTAGQSIEVLAIVDRADTQAIDLTGNELAQTIIGNAGANFIAGLGGGDTMIGLGGDDVYLVENARDKVVEAAGGGTDVVITLSNLSYALGAGLSVEVLQTLDSDNSFRTNLTGNEFAQTIFATDGNNIIDGRGGADRMVGFNGNDTYFVDNAGDTVEEGVFHGTDRILTSVSYSLAQDVWVETLTTTNRAGTAALHLTGNEISQTVVGNAGANVIDGKGGADVMLGLGGNDIYFVDTRADVVKEAAGGGIDAVFTRISYTLGAGQSIEILAATDATSRAALALTGNDLAQTIIGDAGDDLIDGGGGADTMRGGFGDDLYFVDTAADLVVEIAGAGDDRVFSTVSFALRAGQSIETLATIDTNAKTAIDLTGNELAQEIFGNEGANVIDGRGGADRMFGRGGDDTYIVDDAGDTVEDEAASQGNDRILTSVSYVLGADVWVETLATSSRSETAGLNLTGNALSQTIVGNAGANVIDSGGGGDTLLGLGGNDIYFVHDAGDLVVEAAGGGDDKVGASVSYALRAGQEIEQLGTANAAGATAINLTGNEFVQTLIGNDGSNRLDGRGGADSMFGLGGNDVYVVDNAGDRLFEVADAGFDTVAAQVSYALTAGQSIERLITRDGVGTAAINLTGNEVVQTIAGNAGDNILDGKGGNDTLLGGGGHDTFVFDTALDAVTNVDNIVDFVVGADLVDLSHAIFAALAPGSVSSSAFVVGSAATNASQHLIYSSNSGALSYDADGNGAGAAVQFAKLSAGLDLTASSFKVV